MFSDFLIKQTTFNCKLALYFGACPVEFNPHKLTFRIDTFVLPKLHRNFYMCLAWLVAAIPIIILRYSIGDRDKVNLSLGYLFPIVIYVSVFSVSLWKQDVCRICNGLVKLLHDIRDQYTPPEYNPNRCTSTYVLEGMISFITLLYFGLFCQFSMFVFVDPQSVIHVGKLIPKEYFYLPIRLCVIIFHVYLYLVICVNNYISVYAGVIYGFYVTLVFTQELRLNRPKGKYITVDTLRKKAHNLQMVFRSFQVLHSNTISFLGLYLLLFYGAFMLAAVYINFVLIHYWGVLHLMSKALLLMVAFLVMGFWTSILELGKLYFVRGNKLLNSWKGTRWGSAHETKTMNRFRVSCKPIVISYGNQFVIRRVSILLYFRGVVRGTFRTLLTMR